MDRGERPCDGLFRPGPWVIEAERQDKRAETDFCFARSTRVIAKLSQSRVDPEKMGIFTVRVRDVSNQCSGRLTGRVLGREPTQSASRR